MTGVKRQLSDKSAAQVPDALVRAAILHTLGNVTLTFDGLCRTLECNSKAAMRMLEFRLSALVTEGKVEHTTEDTYRRSQWW